MKDKVLTLQESNLHHFHSSYLCSFRSRSSPDSERRSFFDYRSNNYQNKERNREDTRDRRDSFRPSKFDNMGMAGSNLSSIDWNRMELTPFKKDFYIVKIFSFTK